MKNLKLVLYFALVFVHSLIVCHSAFALGPRIDADRVEQSFETVYDFVAWFKNIKDELGFDLKRMSDLDIENSVKLVMHAIDRSDNKIQRVIIAGNGLLFMPILFALMGKDVVFVDADNKYFLERFQRDFPILQGKIPQHFKFSFQIIPGEIGTLDYQAYGLDPHSFDLMTFIDFSGGTGPVGEPDNWMKTARILLKEKAYLIIDHEYPERTLPQLQRAFPQLYILPVYTTEFVNNRVFDVPIPIAGTYGGKNYLYRVKNTSPETSI